MTEREKLSHEYHENRAWLEPLMDTSAEDMAPEDLAFIKILALKGLDADILRWERDRAENRLRVVSDV